MGRIAIILVLAAIGAGITWLAQNWDEVRVAMGVETTVDLRAVNIAKTEYTLAQHEPNHRVIATRMKEAREIEGLAVEELGWQAKARSDRVYVVSFLFKLDGEERGYYFEVDVGNTNVCLVEPHSELAEKYGITAAMPR